jgi:hypothetical protein
MSVTPMKVHTCNLLECYMTMLQRFDFIIILEAPLVLLFNALNFAISKCFSYTENPPENTHTEAAFLAAFVLYLDLYGNLHYPYRFLVHI